MLNEDDLRPGDVIQDAVGDFWHVHDDGKIWCSEPEFRISFETANGSCWPFTYPLGYNSKQNKDCDSEDDSVKDEGKWTRDDLPEPSRLSRLKHEIVKDFFWEDILDEIADHLNAHCPKPAHRLLSSAAECVLGAEDRVRSAKAERDEWKARAEAAERERDVAVKHRDQMHMQGAPAVTRDDIDRALINVTSNAMNYPTPSQMLGKDTGPLRRKCVDAVCDLLGIEAEQSVDLIEEKAISAFKKAWHEADMRGDEGNRTRRGIRAARKVIEGDGE